MKNWLILLLIPLIAGCATSGPSRGKLSDAFDKADNPDSSSRYIEDTRRIERDYSPWDSTDNDDSWRKVKPEKNRQEKISKTTKKADKKKTSVVDPKVKTVIFKRTLNFQSGLGYHFMEFGEYRDHLAGNLKISLGISSNDILFINRYPLFPYIKDAGIYKELKGGLNGMYPIVVTEDYVFSKHFEKIISHKEVPKIGRNQLPVYNSFTVGFGFNTQFILHDDYTAGVGGNINLGFIYNSWAFNLKLGTYFVKPSTNLSLITSDDVYLGAGIGFDIRKRLFEVSRNVEASIMVESAYSMIGFNFKYPLTYYERDSSGNIISEHVIKNDSIGIFSIGIGPGLTFYNDRDYCITVSAILGYSLLAPYTVERFDNDVFESFPYIKLMVDLAIMVK